MIGTRYQVAVPRWTDKDGAKRGGYVRNCTLRAIINAGETPAHDDVARWYGADAPKSVFKPSKPRRLVFEYAPGEFIIVPDVPRNRGTWRSLD